MYEREKTLGNFANGIGDLMFQGANTFANLKNDELQEQKRIDTQHMKLQLEADTDEFLLNLEKDNDFEGYENKINAFLNERKQQMQNKESPYYAKNQSTAQDFYAIIGSNAQALQSKVNVLQWQKEKAKNRQQLSDDLSLIQNKTIKEKQIGENGEVIDNGYSLLDRNSEAMNYIYSYVKAGYFSLEEGDKLAQQVFSENLTAQTQAMYTTIWQEHPEMTESQVTAEVNKRMQLEHLDTGDFYTFYGDKQEFDEWYRTGRITGESEKPTAYAERQAQRKAQEATGENTESTGQEENTDKSLFDTIDHEKAINKGQQQALATIKQAQKEKNDEYLRENSKVRDDFYRLQVYGEGKGGTYDSIINRCEEQLKALDKEKNFTMDEGDNRQRRNDLYMMMHSAKGAKEYEKAKKEAKAPSVRSSGSGEKVNKKDILVYSTDYISLMDAKVNNGEISPSEAQQSTQDFLMNCIATGRGADGEFLTYNGIGLSELDSTEDVKTVIMDRVIKPSAEKCIKTLRNRPECASIEEKYKRLYSQMEKNPELYSDEALTKFVMGTQSIYYGIKAGQDEETALQQLQDMHDYLQIEAAETRMSLIRTKQGDIIIQGEQDNKNKIPDEKGIVNIINNLNSSDNFVFRNVNTGKDTYLNDKAKEQARQYTIQLKEQLAYMLGKDGDDFTADYKRTTNGHDKTDPTLRPYFKDNKTGEIYELRVNDDGKGYSIYKTTGGKDEKLNLKHKNRPTDWKRKQAEAKARTKAVAEAKNKTALASDPLTTSISKDLQLILQKENISLEDWNKKSDEDKKVIRHKYNL